MVRVDIRGVLLYNTNNTGGGVVRFVLYTSNTARILLDPTSDQANRSANCRNGRQHSWHRSAGCIEIATPITYLELVMHLHAAMLHFIPLSFEGFMKDARYKRKNQQHFQGAI